MNDARSTSPEQLGVLLKDAQSVLHQRMDEALRPLDLSVSQYACLHHLHQAPGITASELARRAFVTRQAMSVLLKGLQRQGLVARADEQGPRRERAMTLTSEAEEILHQAGAAVSEVVGLMTAPLDQADRDDLARLLLACRDSLLHG
ncbi:MarR family transcriptional regulator [Demequina capsici]|uniref:MarR family transcriptional regulator n=1 Tax=Demequina capsici TaxID=3075620 RepID=A0AA96JDH6_9MICO|nr:MarR family transcriptional regulator [Demequina sp. PMTSA13]WNM28051.1 MarR family transcriptional regulator [Demequina sp. PMTSA13]